MLIREIQEKDNQVIQMIIQQSLKSFDLAIPGTAYFDPQLANLAGYYQQLPNGNYWVVEENGQILGGCGIGPFDEEKGICELQKIYLTPESQGKGVAKKLMNKALAYAEEHYDFCYLETMKRMEKANKLYQSFGFQQLAEPLKGSEHSAMECWYLKKLKENN
ncbi:GNAT family N-acetyltransferase [Enterococcus rivorum]|uniref:GNAT family N-acetyltransferase n=1 Tax=Enterococcus rivorum TaxID=762845 RepID=A0A1E5L1H7_9ENTE|nr:GNAT family N-acetyltransferase [Enterococcus rivorum]MBP2098776.1 putative acetyltransferase [Enterococcus rivorum]OEH83965.1 GNAT family N-acetyltransferase [Enterococcus rivorum]